MEYTLRVVLHSSRPLTRAERRNALMLVVQTANAGIDVREIIETDPHGDFWFESGLKADA